ncbi:adenylyl-sulfate kinase [uncultured Pseudodesulfovibrio sp.]|uniref:adenylyl-sulfate kinase n=1 Tax=uncultured Pseudodesulfovibrio sp. TaxID=2035858 RepID=UPI0029C609C5|nr:adenylyl-sulfate kinase [uncultured Pseudodesulfovibrio sp.]
MSQNKYVCRHRGEVCREDREDKNGFRAVTIWFSGLSGAGKSTIAHKVEKRLFDEGAQVYTFDGDNVRQGLCSDLSFSPEGRQENIRRISEMTKLFMDAGIICLCAFITPSRATQQQLREGYGKDEFFLVHVDCPVEVCESRDVKGYYELARKGKIKDYTGVSGTYESPIEPDLTLKTDICPLEECVEQAYQFVIKKLARSEAV